MSAGALISEVSQDLTAATSMITDLQHALDQQKRKSAEIEREKRLLGGKVDGLSRMLEQKDKQLADANRGEGQPDVDLPALQKSDRELGALRDTLREAGFIRSSDFAKDLSSEQRAELRALICDALAVREKAGSLIEAGQAAEQLKTLAEERQAMQTQIQELMPFRAESRRWCQ